MLFTVTLHKCRTTAHISIYNSDPSCLNCCWCAMACSHKLVTDPVCHMSKAVWAFHGLLIAFSAVCNRILPAALHLLCPTLSAPLQDGDLVTALHVFNTWSDISSGNGSSQPSSHHTSADGASSVADDISDTASDISGSHTASSIGQGPTGRVAAGHWCHTNSVNNKVLGIADATRQAPASVKPLSRCTIWAIPLLLCHGQSAMSPALLCLLCQALLSGPAAVSD